MSDSASSLRRFSFSGMQHDQNSPQGPLGGYERERVNPMTFQSPTATEPGRANNPPGVAHAFVQNGAIHLLQFGRIEPVSRWDAVCALSAIDQSTNPDTQERARQIRAALKETMQ